MPTLHLAGKINQKAVKETSREKRAIKRHNKQVNASLAATNYDVKVVQHIQSFENDIEDLDTKNPESPNAANEHSISHTSPHAEPKSKRQAISIETGYKEKYEQLLQKHNQFKVVSRRKIRSLHSVLTYYKNIVHKYKIDKYMIKKQRQILSEY